MSAFMIARITTRDPVKLKEYMSLTTRTAAQFGAELVGRGRAARTLNGAGDHESVVVARFPSLERLEAWYDSDAYRPLKALRDEAANMHMTAYALDG